MEKELQPTIQPHATQKFVCHEWHIICCGSVFGQIEDRPTFGAGRIFPRKSNQTWIEFLQNI